MTDQSAASPIVDGAWLETQLEDDAVKIIEVCSDPDDSIYRGGHIPGAVRFFWKDLCWHASNRQFVTSAELAERLGAAGISDSDTLVLYGDPVQYGTYAFWALTMAGHGDLKLLDGARKKWIADERPMSTDIPAPAPTTYAPQEGDAAMRVGRDDILAHLGDADRFLLDVRSPEEYSGERVMEYGKFDHGAERGGRIPGAKHLFFKELLNEDDTFKPAGELKAKLDAAGADPTNAGEIVCYCRLSHRATLAWTAMTFILGYEGVKIYDGSWTEWGSIVGFPVEK
ncbi:MAG: sulfurtransferase [Rhodospirillales bacterium]|jgi:thiosulfate/3-mercaptopyruvate sulfurtransferase|nr:sulfurtransferase [Rhodospirillaceae bacterium]MDP6428500.1 sulfurtransferase [Rhodospirillales bacterium]MDP6645449.1 sulfurtransferase [Rhodospirillales bacterium]MDP6842670.1 sulfurtransferase [Rhodospirillales bacterium]|tara:strand:- start:475 stop:1326 length:852 start_codon:yes stop_codon:yes gene_type:complete